MALFSKNYDFKIKRDHQQKSYESCDYESVDGKSLSLAMSQKTMKKEFRIQEQLFRPAIRIQIV